MEVKTDRQFGGTYQLRLRGESQARNEYEADSKAELHASSWHGLLFDHEEERHVPPKRRFTLRGYRRYMPEDKSLYIANSLK
jgi:hypothetical protein